MTTRVFGVCLLAFLLHVPAWAQRFSENAELAEKILAAREAPGRTLDAPFRAQVLRGLLDLPVSRLRQSLDTLNVIPLSVGDSTSDLVYRALPQPCRIIDTRLAGGPLTSARDFRVAGTASLAAQGGSAGGCGIPLGGATAAMINFVAVNPTAPGNLRGAAWPLPVPAVGSVINYQALSPVLNIANGVIFPICDASTAACATGADITLQPNGGNTDLVADVLGYFTRYPETPSASDLVYTTLSQPCRIIDTRQAGGSLSAGVPRGFQVSGTAGFDLQGGTDSGCGIPEGAAVAMINFVAVNAQGNGNLRGAAYPNAVPATGSVINYQALSPALNVANGILFPLCDPTTATCTADITLQANAAGTDLVADVLGYFRRITDPAIPDLVTSQSDLTYTRFQQPCRIIDTRSGGGLLTVGAVRDFKVAGTAGFGEQGGTDGGCGVPSGATVAMINFVAVNAQGNGNLKGSAFPSAIPATGSVINYQALTPALNIANGLLFPICDPTVATCTSDIRLQANGAGTHVVADVMGFARRPVPVPDLDQDGDGWTPLDGDCCDVPGFCPVPAEVNPGAFEVPGNLIDDDCDGNVDEEAAACDAVLASNSSDPVDFARAADLCQFTTEAPPVATRTWGVINAQLLRVDGTANPAADARSIRTNFGAANSPRGGNRMTILSTGNAAAPGQTSPGFVAFQVGKKHGLTSAFPSDWYTANGNDLPSAPGCPRPTGALAQDPIMMQLRVRVPTNARSFSVSTRFFSAEFPEWVCSAFNDFFVVLLDSSFSGSPANPTDKNLARFVTPGGTYPVGVNLAYGNTGLFTACKNGPIGCEGVDGTINTCTAPQDLDNTGFETDVSGGCGPNDEVGGGTSWLRVRGNVVPGETITLRFAIWDTSDDEYDSLVLIDNFQWSTEATTPGAFAEP